MNIRDYILVTILLVLSFQFSISQNLENKTLEIKPYLGLSSPVGDFKEFSENGGVFGVAIDKYLGNRFALGLDINYQNNEFSNPLDYQAIAIPNVLKISDNNSWTTTSFLVGPTYRIGGNKFSAEIYTKAGISLLKTPSKSVVFSQLGTPDVSLLELKEDNTTALGLNSGIRFNYAINKKVSVFFNPQYQFINKDIEYFHRPITTEAISNPDLLAIDGGNLCYIKPSYLNFNFGVSFNLGGTKSKIKDNEEIESQPQGICGETKLKSPYNGETYFADSGIVPEFNWINHSNPNATSYVFELFSGEKRIFKKKVKKPNFKFTKKMTLDFYGIKETRNYSWRIITNYSKCEPSITDFYYFKIQPPNTAIRSQCHLIFTVDDIYCDSPAYAENGNKKYSGTFTVKNNSTLPAVLSPHSWSTNPSQVFGVDTPGATLTFSQGNFSSSCPPTPMVNTTNGLALPSMRSATYCFNLEVPYTTNSLLFLANIDVYNGGLAPAQCPEQVRVELPVCACDACDSWDFTDETHNSIYDSSNNNPYLSHVLFQRFKLPGSDPIKRMKAEIIYVKHKVNDPKCYNCTTEVKDMGLFSAVNAKPKDLGANPLDWINNNEGVLGLDKNTDGFSNMINWQARNPITGVDFSSRDHNFRLYINLPGDDNFDCCKNEYEVWVRYTFEDINCITCSTLVKYDLSASHGSTVGTIGTGIGNTGTGVINPGTSVPHSTNTNITPLKK